MNVLAVGCHPDDLEIGCGGTLCQIRQTGRQCHHVQCCQRQQGHVIIPPTSCVLSAGTRYRQAVKILGVKENITLDVGDLRVDSYNLNVVHALIDVIRHVEPDLIITHCPQDFT